MIEMIYIVTGLPRSGTSLIMQMLYSGGLPVFADSTRKADQHNEKGYFEHPDVDNIRKDNSFLKNCRGKAVKIVAHRMYWLDDSLNYRVIYMHRNIHSTCRSQEEMIKVRGKQPEDIEVVKQKYLNFLDRFLNDFQDWDMKEFNYEDILDEPRLHSYYMAKFLSLSLDTRKMSKAVDRELQHD